MLYDRVRLKQNAKAAMAHANPKTWLVTLILLLLTGTVSGALNALAPNPLGEYVGALTIGMLENGGYGLTLGDLLPGGAAVTARIGAFGLAAVFSLTAVVVSTLFSVVMSYGYSRYALEVYRREAYAGAGSIFKGFPRLPTVVGASVLVGVFSFLWGLLIYGVDIFITALVLALTDGSRVGTWIGLIALFVIASVVHTLVTYRYCLTAYFVMDDEKRPALQAINASTQAMKGNTGKRFVLGLSFLGWELLRWLITVAVAAVGGVFVFLILGSGLGSLAHLGQGSYAQMGMAAVGLAVAVLVIVIVAVLVQLPLELWLISYKSISYAGFYQLATGQAEKVPATAPVTGSLYFNNTQPSAVTEKPPVVAEEPSVETTPAMMEAPDADEETSSAEEEASAVAQEPPQVPPYTPFGGSADVVSETPETPAPPEAPEAPTDEDN